MNDVEIYFEIPHITLQKYKEKNVIVLKKFISGSRLNDILRFLGYGYFEYTDNKQNKLIGDVLDIFKRGKVNCLCYKIILDNNYNSVYDTLFIFFYDGNMDSAYHYILKNSKNNECIHIYFIEYLMDILCMSLNKMIMNVNHWNNLLLEYNKKY